MADKLLAVRGGEPVGKHWAERFVTRSAELKMAFNRAKDRQRILQEDPEIIGAWFKLVEETKAKYGVLSRAGVGVQAVCRYGSGRIGYRAMYVRIGNPVVCSIDRT
jgi:hypothetical protein